MKISNSIVSRLWIGSYGSFQSISWKIIYLLIIKYLNSSIAIFVGKTSIKFKDLTNMKIFLEINETIKLFELII